MTQKNFEELTTKCGGKYKWWNQSTYCKQVAKRHQEGVCAASSIVFLYSTFLRGHDFADSGQVEGLVKSFKEYQDAHPPLERTTVQEDDEDEDDLEMLNFGIHYDDPSRLFPLIKAHDVGDYWKFRGQWNEEKKKYESTDSKKHAKKVKKLVNGMSSKVMGRQEPTNPPLSFRKLIRWRGVENLVNLQDIESSSSQEERMPYERAELMMDKASNKQLKIVRRALLFNSKVPFSAGRLEPILSYHGCYYVHVTRHAMAAYVDRRVGKYKYFEPNAGIATFNSAEDLMEFTSAWLKDEYADRSSVGFYHFL
ncbi:hypothetical protein D187_007577 [Cystobacter fuscus DSM 2262]|uniref:Uncharacterized protein n=1 Tax=Cystobacter fuscus (strain ATCC 25194 / DSM 2262 / NBRC 100088 / M29) TaxID=1242864 RepID=S9NVM4_CYSF2|nr:YopT-type cysteine protease domain-containing protein [Cystobacter fuscus]EPX56235.1 hypothetical protein D187_007577 [Cystobacter fuscus DSM 2262]